MPLTSCTATSARAFELLSPTRLSSRAVPTPGRTRAISLTRSTRAGSWSFLMEILSLARPMVLKSLMIWSRIQGSNV